MIKINIENIVINLSSDTKKTLACSKKKVFSENSKKAAKRQAREQVRETQ
jgi:hypothetical protein